MIDRRGLLAVLAGGMLAPGAWPLATGAARAQGAADPQQYRRMALMGGEFAIQTSRLALERGIDPRVREFAQLEINEQTAFAASLGVRPGGVPLRPDQEQLLQRLAATPSGSRFDRAYVGGQIDGHEELLVLNSAYAQGGYDTVGQAVATVAVPSIQTHLTILSRLRRA
jgi:putative membrane protein